MEKCHMTNITYHSYTPRMLQCHITHMMGSHDKCGKIVHRLCSSCISSVQEINKNSIKFSLSTQTWSGFKLFWLEPYNFIIFYSGLFNFLKQIYSFNDYFYCLYSSYFQLLQFYQHLILIISFYSYFPVQPSAQTVHFPHSAFQNMF